MYRLKIGASLKKKIIWCSTLWNQTPAHAFPAGFCSHQSGVPKPCRHALSGVTPCTACLSKWQSTTKMLCFVMWTELHNECKRWPPFIHMCKSIFCFYTSNYWILTSQVLPTCWSLRNTFDGHLSGHCACYSLYSHMQEFIKKVLTPSRKRSQTMWFICITCGRSSWDKSGEAFYPVGFDLFKE